MLCHCSHFMLTVVSVCSALAWIPVPFISLFSAPSTGEDVTKFLAASGIAPVLVMLGALSVILLMV